jgi:hypothetical protein
MNVIKREFVLEIHAGFGSLGARPVGMPHADPLGGMAVAHDVLEHFPGDGGGVHDELMALGAALFVRGRYYFGNNGGNPSPEDNISADFPELFHHVIHEDFALRRPPKSKRTYVDEELQEIVRLGFRKIRDAYPEDALENKTWLDHDRWLGWLRRGYRRAVRRYRDCPDHAVCGMFLRIEELADRAIKQGEEGDRFTVSVSLHRRDVALKRMPYEFEGY